MRNSLQSSQRKKNPLAKELSDPKYRVKTEPTKKQRLREQQDDEAYNEIRDFLNGNSEV